MVCATTFVLQFPFFSYLWRYSSACYFSTSPLTTKYQCFRFLNESVSSADSLDLQALRQEPCIFLRNTQRYHYAKELVFGLNSDIVGHLYMGKSGLPCGAFGYAHLITLLFLCSAFAQSHLPLQFQITCPIVKSYWNFWEHMRGAPLPCCSQYFNPYTREQKDLHCPHLTCPPCWQLPKCWVR